MVFALWDVTRYRDDFSTVGLFTAGFHRLSLVDENGPEVVDVGQGRAGYDLIAERLEESVPIVVGETLLGVDAQRLGARKRVRADDCASDLFGAVHAVGIAGNGVNALEAIQMNRQRQEEFDVAAAAAVSPDGDRSLSAGDQCARSWRGLIMTDDLAGDSAHDAADFRGFAFDRIAEDERSMPASRATLAAASSEAWGVAMMRFVVRAKAGSPGFGVSAFGSSSSVCTDAGTVIPYRLSTALASASVLKSGVVGPEAMTDGSSPGTSEMISDTT
jgi:hypothetical protein